jgi:hypothetical protein
MIKNRIKLGRLPFWTLTAWCVLTLGFSDFVGLTQSVGPNSSKENLDLPYDALGEDVDEDALLEAIVFYGGVYEANSVVFCLDYSNSMRKRGELELQTREALRTFDELSSRVRFGIVFYGGTADLFRRQLVVADATNKAAAKRAIVAKPLSLGTCMGPALRKALKLLHGEKHGVVILAGDGKPTTCPHGGGADKAMIRRQVLAEALAGNAERSVVIHSIYVGDPSAGDPLNFMRQIGRDHGGSFRVVPTRD